MTHQDIQYTGNSEVMADKEVYRLLKARDTAFRSADSLRAARVNLSHVASEEPNTATPTEIGKALGVWGKAFRSPRTTNTHQRPLTVTLLPFSSTQLSPTRAHMRTHTRKNKTYVRMLFIDFS